MKIFNFLRKDSFTVFESLVLILIFLTFLSVFRVFNPDLSVLGNFIVLILALSVNLIGTSGILTIAFSFLFFYLKKKNHKSFKDYNIEVSIAIWVVCAFVEIGLRNFFYTELELKISHFSTMVHWFVAPLIYIFFFFNLAKRKYYPEVKQKNYATD